MSYSLDKAIEQVDRQIQERESVEREMQRDLDDHKQRTAALRKERTDLTTEKDSACVCCAVLRTKLEGS